MSSDSLQTKTARRNKHPRNVTGMEHCVLLQFDLLLRDLELNSLVPMLHVCFSKTEALVRMNDPFTQNEIQWMLERIYFQCIDMVFTLLRGIIDNAVVYVETPLLTAECIV